MERDWRTEMDLWHFISLAEVGLEVATDLEERLGSWQAEESLVLGIEGNIIEARGGNSSENVV